MNYSLYQGSCLDVVPTLPSQDCIFADPFDNLGLKYNGFKDKMPDDDYIKFLDSCLCTFATKAPIVWFSFYVKWTVRFGAIADEFLYRNPDWECKPCVQHFSFGQHNHHDLGNNHRPLWRFKHKDAPLYPDQIRVPSWRQLNGDKRADPRGRVPGDVFDFPRVTGNSKQRRSFHPTQLNEGLVERCIKLSTKEGDTVLDPFGGTGTTLRVCKRVNRTCTLIELSDFYCEKIAGEHGLTIDKAQATADNAA